MLGQESDNRITLGITNNSLHFQWLQGNNKGNWYDATFDLPAGTYPQQLRATITGYHPTNEIGTRDIGAVIGAILKIEDGTLTLAGIQGRGEEPPKGPLAFEENALFRYALKKVQLPKENTGEPTSRKHPAGL